MSTATVNSVGDLKSSISEMNGHPHLTKFKEAKQQISIVFKSIEHYALQCYKFTEEQNKDEKFVKLIGMETHKEIYNFVDKIKNIQEIIARNHMKCAFFGRTSNGKSSVINGMLGSRLLPSCVGHTTSCFLEVQGTDQPTGYILTPDDSNSQANQTHPIESVSQLANAVSNFKLSTDTLLKIFWPNSACRLLREDVVLLDSPGINVDPDIDKWIDMHCLDADVFILVANAESTLMQAEKDFFHRVIEKLSKPNIFILNNRWDASANEMEFVKEVRDQHMQRCVAFLVDELKVASHGEAEELVFFVSAREALAIRTRNNRPSNSSPPGAISTFEGKMPYLAEGWQDRLDEFVRFEAIFEKILSESATRTKFASHSEQGKDILNRIRNIMEKVYETTVEEKDAAVRCRHLYQTHFEEVRACLMNTSNVLDEIVHASLARIEAQVAGALNAEIRRLNELVDSYARPFHSDLALLHVYKTELNTHIERELGRKITEACSSDIFNEVSRSEQIMMKKFASIVADESCKNRILQALNPVDFSPELHVDCRNLCADFREDIEFRFSLSLGTLFQRLSSANRLYAHRSYPHRSVGSSNILSNSSMTPWAIDLFPMAMGRSAVGIALLLAITTKAVGWRAFAMAAGIYGGLYLYERLSWTNKAKELCFKRQYVDFASQKLRLIVDLTSTSARHQAKRELQVAVKKVMNEVVQFCDQMSDNVKQLDVDINRLDSIISDAKQLKNRSDVLSCSLNKFHERYITNPWSSDLNAGAI